MATTKYDDLGKECYILATDSDLVIRVLESEEVKDGPKQSELVPKKVHLFKVKRDILAASSDYFRTMFGKPGFRESQQTIVDLKEDLPVSVEVWLRIIHGSDTKATYGRVDLKGVWEVLAAAHKYSLDPKQAGAKEWFRGWYTTNEAKANDSNRFRVAQQLLFPCHSFDHIEGFAAATKILAYGGAGHVTEQKPHGITYDHLRLESRVIQQLNAAKGRLKTILHRELYGPIDELLGGSNCSCRAAVLYDYEKSLARTGAWPLETAFVHKSMDDIMTRLNTFTARKVEKPEPCGPDCCSFNFEQVVSKATSEVKKYFDGSCLKCMDRSQPKFGSDDRDYWRHADTGVAWDSKCGISHGEPTWYFSFMGRKQKQVEWTQKKRDRYGGR